MCSLSRAWACPHAGFPIRISPAQTAAHTSPGLFVVYHVLHRHETPRHSPDALVASPEHFSSRSASTSRTTPGCAAAEKLKRWRYLSIAATSRLPLRYSLALLAMHLVKNCAVEHCVLTAGSLYPSQQTDNPYAFVNLLRGITPSRSLVRYPYRRKRPDTVGPHVLATPLCLSKLYSVPSTTSTLANRAASISFVSRFRYEA